MTFMNSKLFVINICLVVCDLLLAALAVCAFAWAAVYFHKWWLILFTLIPVILYTNHSIILDRDIMQKEGEQDRGE